MIYILPLLSVVCYLSLHIWQRYLEYFPKSKTLLHNPPVTFVAATIKSNFFRNPDATAIEKSYKWKIAIISGVKSFFLYFGLVGLFFCILQLWLLYGANRAFEEQTILNIEQKIRWLQEKTAKFNKYKFWPDLALVTIFIFLTAIWSFAKKLKEYYKTLMKVVGIIIALITIATSFTFYGNSFKKDEKGIEGKLKIHELAIIEGNKLLLKQIRDFVENRVATEILNDPDVTQIIIASEELKESSDSILSSPDYAFYTRYDNSGDSGLATFLSSIGPDYDIIENFQKSEQNFLDNYKSHFQQQPGPAPSSSAAGTDFYSDLSEKQYNDFKTNQQKWFVESELSEKSVKASTEAFSHGSEAAETVSSFLFDRYGEVAKKMIKKGYSLSVKGWVNSAVKSFLQDVPLIGEFLDPFHDAIQDYITEKVTAIFKAARLGDINVITNEINNIKEEIKLRIAKAKNSILSVKKIKQKMYDVYIKVKGTLNTIVKTNDRINSAVDEHLQQMKDNDRWQGLREDFEVKAKREYISDHPDEPFSREQWQEIVSVLDDWNTHIGNNKVIWWSAGENNLEENFFQYIMGNPRACAAWGFILQQEDWDRAVEYYAVHPENATGKPYYMLKYYCNSIKKGDQLDNLYNSNTDREVDILCPH